MAQAAEAVGLPRNLAGELAERYGGLQPWPGVGETLAALAGVGLALGVVTNCSGQLGRIAAARVGVDFAVLVAAERAGFYKPDPRPYQLGLAELGVEPSRCLFVAGSAYDLVGTAKVGLPTYWHDRVGMTSPEGAADPIAHERTLGALLTVVDQAKPGK